MRAPLTIGLAGLLALALAPQAPAEDLNRTLRAVGAILHPEDARRFEEQAHRNGRRDEERYWHEYGAGLQRQDPNRRDDRGGNDHGNDRR